MSHHPTKAMRCSIEYAVSRAREFTSVLILVIVAVPSLAVYDFDDSGEFLAPASQWPSWHQTVRRANEEEIQIQSCLENVEDCTRKMKSLRVILTKGEGLEAIKKIDLVNRYINRFRRYSRDYAETVEREEYRLRVYQKWSTLLEFLERGGDCEDFATAKYSILKTLGFPAEDLRILVVFDRRLREYHALVAVRHDEFGVRLLDLDNSIYRRKPAGLRYVYAINEHSIWDHSIQSVPKPRKLKARKTSPQ